MFIYVGGIPATGKTSIIKEAEKLASERKINLKRTIGTDIMCKLAHVRTVDELRRLPEETRRKLRPEMNRLIYEQDRLDPTTIRVCDGHFCFFDIKGEKYGERQVQLEDKQQMKAFVVILADAQTVLRRRMDDKTKRPDRQKDIMSIVKEQLLETMIAKKQARELNIPVKFIINDNKKTIIDCAELLIKDIMQIITWKKG